MILNELFERAKPEYQDIQDDNTQLTKDDLRKTRLTLKQINKLRRMNDIRTVEMQQKIKKVQTQYGPQEEAGGMGGMGGF
jgi:CHASE3 domain sensor protein